jgi:hypothetical protein
MLTKKTQFPVLGTIKTDTTQLIVYLMAFYQFGHNYFMIQEAKWSALQDSNLCLSLRRGSFYPAELRAEI